jgi:hypothetical protein
LLPLPEHLERHFELHVLAFSQQSWSRVERRSTRSFGNDSHPSTIALVAARFHDFGVARQGSWNTWVNRDQGRRAGKVTLPGTPA